MQFLTFLATLSTLSTTVLAATICHPLGTDCFGDSLCCEDIPENHCCWRDKPSTSIRFTVPENSMTESFPDTKCAQMDDSHSFSNQPAVTLCWTYKTSVKSARWLTQKTARVKRDDEAQACNVMQPNVVFRVRDGVTTKIKLEGGMSAEEALEMGEGEVVDGITGEYGGVVG